MMFNICHKELFLVNHHKGINESIAAVPQCIISGDLLQSPSEGQAFMQQETEVTFLVLATSKERIYEDMNGC